MEQSLTMEHLFILQFWLRLKWLFHHGNHQESCHIGFHTQILPSLSPVNTHVVLTSKLVTGAAKKAASYNKYWMMNMKRSWNKNIIFKKEATRDMLSWAHTQMLVPKKKNTKESIHLQKSTCSFELQYYKTVVNSLLMQVTLLFFYIITKYQ